MTDHFTTIHSEVRAALTRRVQECYQQATSEQLQQLSVCGLLNLLFLYAGNFGSLGDYSSTQRALRTLLGDALFYRHNEPSDSKVIQ